MRFHEAALCAVALIAPMVSLAIWAVWWVPVIAFFTISLPVIRLVGWLIDTS